MIKTILEVKSGKVMPWAAIQLAAYSLLDTPVDFTEEGHRYVLDGVLLKSTTEILAAEGFIDTTFYTEYGRTRGAYIHTARHFDDAKELDESTIDPIIAPYLEAWRRFKRESGFIVEQSEVPMANKTYRYAGRPDVIGHFPIGTLKKAAVELHDDGKYRLVPFTERQDVNIWLAALAIHNWKANHNRRE